MLLAVVALAAFFLIAGCATDSSRATPDDPAAPTEEEVREAANELADRMIAEIKAGARAINEQTADRRIRERTVQWQSRMVSLIQERVLETDPRRAFLGLWVLAEQQQAYVTTGDGRNFFGAHQQIAIDAANRTIEDVGRTGGRYGRQAIFDRVRPEVVAFAEANPMHGTFRASTKSPTDQPSDEQGGAIGDLLGLPLAPFRAVQGVDNAALAVREVAIAADRMTRVVADLPEQVRWQSQLLAYDLEDRETTVVLREATSQIGASSERLAASTEEFAAIGHEYAEIVQQFRSTIETLPADIRTETDALLTDFDARQAELQTTLASARDAVAEFDTSLQSANKLAQSLDGATASFAEAGAAWEQVVTAVDTMVANMRTPREGAAPAPNAGTAGTGDAARTPFDINDYRLLAEETRGLAVELQSLVREVNTLGESNAIAAGVQETTIGVRAIINYAMWRAIILVAVILVAAIAYRAISVRLSKVAGR